MQCLLDDLFTPQVFEAERKNKNDENIEDEIEIHIKGNVEIKSDDRRGDQRSPSLLLGLLADEEKVHVHLILLVHSLASMLCTET
jgi:hypothetical protein